MGSILEGLANDVLQNLKDLAPGARDNPSPPKQDKEKEILTGIFEYLGVRSIFSNSLLLAYWHLHVFATVMILVTALTLLLFKFKCRGRNPKRVRVPGHSSKSMHTRKRSSRTESPVHVASRPPPVVTSVNWGFEGKDEHTPGDTSQSPQDVSPLPLFKPNISLSPKKSEELKVSKINDLPSIKLRAPISKSATPRKNRPCICHNPHKVRKESPIKVRRQHSTHISPRNKSTELTKFSISNKGQTDHVDQFRTRWNGGVPLRRTHLTRRRYPLQVMPVTMKLNSAQVREHEKHRRTTTSHRIRIPIMMKSSSPSPSVRKPLLQQYSQSSHLSTRNRFKSASLGQRRLTKRSKIQILHHDVSSDEVSYKILSQKEKGSYKMKIDWPECFKSTETLRGHFKQKSPKKIKKSSGLHKCKKASGQKKNKKIRKKLKAKKEDKSRPISMKIEAETSTENAIHENFVLHFPEPCRGVQLPSYVGQASQLSSHAGSFTIKRTATPVLSSLFGQGAFRTCWPQSTIKGSTYPSEEPDNKNTGRHNTKFLGPKAQDSNNETTETVNSGKINSRIWNKTTCDNIYEKRQEFTAFANRGKDLVVENIRLPEKKSFRFPNNERNEQFRETQVFKNARTYNANKTSENIIWDQQKIKDCFQAVEVENSLQFIASSHRDSREKSLKKCKNQQYYSLHPPGEAAGGKKPMQSLQLSNKESTQISEIFEFKQVASSIQCPRLPISGQRFQNSEITSQADENDTLEKCLKRRYTDSKSHRDDFVKIHHSQDHECGMQCPHASLWTQRPLDLEEVTSKDTRTEDRQLLEHRRKEQTRISSLVAGVSHIAASKDDDKRAHFESQGSQRLWKTRVSKDGSVFRVTRNKVMPLFHHRNHCQTLQEPSKPQAKPNIFHKISCTLKDSQKNSKESCCYSDSNSEMSIQSEATSLNDTSIQCSRPTDKQNLLHNRHPVKKNTQVNDHYFEMEDDTFRRDATHNHILCADLNQKRDSKDMRSSIAPDSKQAVGETKTSRFDEDFNERRFLRRLNRCNYFVPSTVNESSNAASDSGSQEEMEEQEKKCQTKFNTISENLNNGAEQPTQNGYRFHDKKAYADFPHVMDKNPPKKEINSHALKVNDQPTTKMSTAKLNIFRGHAVKKKKSLISLRNMLQELTSQVRGNQDSGQNKMSALGRKPRVETVLYFKPVGRFRKPSFNNEERHIDSRYRQEVPLLKSKYSVSSIETSDSYETNDFVKCYRLQRKQSYRHEPYYKRASTSSCTTNEPLNYQYWTRNKNNCSPSRTGRYVLGPLVDKHVFSDNEHPLGVDDSRTPASNVTPLHDGQQQRHRGIGNIAGGFTTTRPSLKRHANIEHITRKYGNRKRSEEGDTDTDPTSKLRSSIADRDNAIPILDEVPQDHVNTGLKLPWHERLAKRHAGTSRPHGAKDKINIGQQTSAAETITAQSTSLHLGNTVGVDSCGGQSFRRSVIRRHTAVEPVKQTEATYTVTRHPGTECPTTGHIIGHTDADIDAGNGNVEKTLLGHTVRERTNTGQTKGHTTTRYTNTELRTTGHTDLILADTRFTNAELKTAVHIDPGHTASKHASAETKLTGCTGHGHAATRHATLETEIIGDTNPGHTAARHATPLKTVQHQEHAHIVIKQSKILNNKHNHMQFTVSSENLPSGSNAKGDKNTDIDTLLCSQPTVDTSEHVLKQFDAKSTVNDLVPSADNTSLFVQPLNSSSSKPKTATRIKVNRISYNRMSLVKNQVGRGRLRGARRQLSHNNISSGEMDTTLPSERLKLKEMFLNLNNLFSSDGGGSKLLTSVPTTENHTTQTEESLVNSVHVSVQTSPHLEVSPKKTSLKCTIKKCIDNAKLLRHKGKQKEHVLSQYRHLRRECGDSFLASSLVPPIWSSEGMRAHDNPTTKRLEYTNPAESKSAEQNTDPAGLNTKITPRDKNSKTEKPRDYLVMRGHRQHVDEKKHVNTPVRSDKIYSMFEHVSKNIIDSNQQNYYEKDSEGEDSHGAESQNEQTNKPESNKRDNYTTINRKPSVDKQRDERRTLPNLSFQLKSESRDHDDRERKQVKDAHLGNSENQKYNSTLPAQQGTESLVKADATNEAGSGALIATSSISRADTEEMTDSSCMSSRFSDLRKFCAIRPVWKNAKVEEIDRRVNRALRLREELKQKAVSGSQARSLIASYFETSSASTAKNYSGRANTASSSTAASDFESTNKSLLQAQGTAPFQDASSDNTLCHTVDQAHASSRRSSSSESGHTRQNATESAFKLESAAAETVINRGPMLLSNTDFRTSSGTTPNQTRRKRSLDDERHGSVVTHSRSVHELPAAKLNCRPEKTPSDHISSQPSNTSSGTSMQQAGRRNTNSPPTKISKVENVPSSTPRLVGALVQKLPQVPLSSFVEWFIETSDPNNFVSSDRSSSSSDNTQSNSACFVPLTASSVTDHAGLTKWPDPLQTETPENKAFMKDAKLKRAICASSSRKTHLEKMKNPNQSDQNRTAERSKCLTTDTPLSDTRTSNLTQSFPSVIPFTPSSTSYALSGSDGDVDQESVLEMDQAAINEEHLTSTDAEKKAGIFKHSSKSIINSKPSTQSVKGVCSKFSFTRKSSDSLLFRRGSAKYTKPPKNELTRQSAFHIRRQYNELIDTPTTSVKSNEQADNSTYLAGHSELVSYVHNSQSGVSKLKRNSLPHTTETISFRHDLSILEGKRCREASTSSITKCDQSRRSHLEMAQGRDYKSSMEAADSKPGTDDVAYPQGVTDCQDKLPASLTEETGETNRCAPGIRHILMKLRQTSSDVDDLAAGRPDRMKITLRKSSDVTGIIAKFQNK